MKLFIYLFLFLFTILGYSQYPIAEYENFQRVLRKSSEVNNEFVGYVEITQEDLKQMNGSPYEQNEFKLGNVYYDDKIIFENVFLRYNALLDQMEFKTNPSLPFKSLNRDPNIKVSINSYNYILMFDPFGTGQKHFKIIHNGDNIKLLKRIDVKFYAPQYARTSYEIATLPTFKKSVSYLLNIGDKYYKVSKNRKKNNDIFLNLNQDLQKHIDSENLNLKKIEDIKKMVVYFDLKK